MNKKYIVYILVLYFVFCFNFTVRGEQGLVGWWKFDEGSGEILKDSSGNGNDGKIQGAIWVKGNKGCALLFDEGDYVDCGNDVSLQLDGPLTISMWINVASVAQGHQYIVSNHGWNLGIGGGNFPVFETKDAQNVKWWGEMRPGKTIPTDIWVYIVIVYSIKNQEMVFYVDGEKVMSEARTDGGIGGVDLYPVVFGKESPALPQRGSFHGLLSEIKIYNKDLTAEEIKRNYELEKETKD